MFVFEVVATFQNFTGSFRRINKFIRHTSSSFTHLNEDMHKKLETDITKHIWNVRNRIINKSTGIGTELGERLTHFGKYS
jgi:hypothetical protein